jgi:hypothetical protein
MHAYVLAQKVDLYHLVSIFSLEYLALNIWALSQLEQYDWSTSFVTASEQEEVCI